MTKPPIFVRKSFMLFGSQASLKRRKRFQISPNHHAADSRCSPSGLTSQGISDIFLSQVVWPLELDVNLYPSDIPEGTHHEKCKGFPFLHLQMIILLYLKCSPSRLNLTKLDRYTTTISHSRLQWAQNEQLKLRLCECSSSTYLRHGLHT